MKGIGVSEGIGIGKVYIKEELPEIKKQEIFSPKEEIKRFNNCIETVEKELEELYEEKKISLGESEAQIFKAHLMILKDPELLNKVIKNIEDEKVNSEYALKKVIDEFVKLFENMDNEYFRERALDIKDIGRRITKHLLNLETKNLSDLEKGTIVVAKDLTPSDTAGLIKENIEGIITEEGGKTSHSAIIANTLGIPAVMGVKNIIKEIKNNEEIIIDGKTGEVSLKPSKEKIDEYRIKREKEIKEKEELKKMIGKESITKDKKEIEISANIASLSDIENALENDAEGVGLFRSEFIYMEGNTLPSEEKQYKIYKEALERFGKKPVVIRTMDIGGDKEVSYLDFEKEMNPFLGYRAIRYCLDEKEVFKTQLRALLRASKHGKLRIMFPMISSMKELKKTKEILEECKKELREEEKEYSEELEIGIMIEVPSAAMISDKLAKEVDFFSIGTNDLIQYTTATDRMNPNLKELYTPYNLGVLRLIDMTIKNGHKENIWVGMCGSVAGNEYLIPLLLGMGLDEFSMSPSSILRARKIIRNSSIKELQELTKKVLDAEDKDEVKELLNVK